jgi:hypothetical protein
LFLFVNCFFEIFFKKRKPAVIWR